MTWRWRAVLFSAGFWSLLAACSTSNQDQEKDTPRPEIRKDTTENRRTYWDEDQEELKETYFVLKDSQFVKHGPYRMYSKEGVMTMEYNYRMGMPDGPVKDYYPSGELYSEYEYRGGKPNGPFTWYYKSGGVKMTGTYLNGKYHDTLREYDTTGTLTRTITEFENLK